MYATLGHRNAEVQRVKKVLGDLPLSMRNTSFNLCGKRYPIPLVERNRENPIKSLNTGGEAESHTKATITAENQGHTPEA
jgi:hypothetical protein